MTYNLLPYSMRVTAYIMAYCWYILRLLIGDLLTSKGRSCFYMLAFLYRTHCYLNIHIQNIQTSSDSCLLRPNKRETSKIYIRFQV